MEEKKEIEKYYDEDYDTEFILVNNENYEDFIGLDIECVSFISAGAQGASGRVAFWTSDGLAYMTNYVYSIEYENLVKVIPMLKKSYDGLFWGADEGDVVTDDWVFHYGGGPGWYVYIKKGLEEKYL